MSECSETRRPMEFFGRPMTANEVKIWRVGLLIGFVGGAATGIFGYIGFLKAAPLF